jgi:hypothetical protein
LSLHLPTPTRSLFRDFHVIHGRSEPAGDRSSSGKGSVVVVGYFALSFFQSAERASSGGEVRGVTEARKLCRLRSRGVAGTWLKRGWRGSSSCFLRSAWLATRRRIAGGAMPAHAYTRRSPTFVGRRQPVMTRQVSLRATSTFDAWVDLSQTGHAYSAAEKQRASADVRSVRGSAPHRELQSFFSKLLRQLTFPFTRATCSLNERVRSRVTPRYVGWVV